MGFFKSKKQKEMEKARRECDEFVREYEKKEAELADAREQEKRVLQEYAMLGKRLGEYLAGDRVLLYGSQSSFYKRHLRYAKALEIVRTPTAEMDWMALAEKCEEFRPTVLLLTFLRKNTLDEVRAFARQIVQKQKDIVIVAFASEANTPGYVDTKLEEPAILVVPLVCGSEQFCGELTEFLKSRRG